MNEVHQPMRKISGKVRAEVGAAVLFQPPGHIHPRKLLAGQLDVGIGLIISQQNVVTRFVLLDQIVFERQRLFVVVDLNKVDIAGFADQRVRLRVRQPVFVEVAADAGSKFLAFPT